MTKQIRLIVFIFSFCHICHAQDVHFSQYYNSPLLINPALTGNFKGSGRFALNYKNQWGSLTNNPYRTEALMYDQPLFKQSFFAGMQIYNDRAGDSQMGLTQIAMNIASKVKVHKNDFLKLGIQGAWSYRSINSENLTWNSQFNGNVIDPGLSSNEKDFQDKFSYIDCSVGLLWSHVLSNKRIFNIGISAFHITQPGYFSFIFYDELHIRWNIHGDYSIPILNNSFTIIPSSLIMIQGSSKEIHIGVSAKYFYGLDARLIENPTYISFGIYYRNQDAVIILAGISFKSQFEINISYDLNISKLHTATNLRGGTEISLVYKIPEKQLYKIKRK